MSVAPRTLTSRSEKADMITPKELVGLLPPTFDPDYVDGAVVPYLQSGQYVGERPALPLIDLALSKENAAPPHFWGMLYDGWAPNPEEEGVTVFIQGYEQRGPDNERKKIYLSATTPDLYAAKYGGKVAFSPASSTSPTPASR
jgi:hypothetical protein